jgi:hypothetical protein
MPASYRLRLKLGATFCLFPQLTRKLDLTKMQRYMLQRMEQSPRNSECMPIPDGCVRCCQILDCELAQRVPRVFKIISKAFLQNIDPYIMDSEFCIPVAFPGVLRRDISDPVPLRAGQMEHEHTDRVHVRAGRPVESIRGKPVERLKNFVMTLL